MYLYDQYDQYLEDLLCAQYEVADIFDHHLAKGEVREDFLIKLLEESSPHFKIHKGFLSNGTANSPQCDLMVCRPSARIRQVGSQALIDVSEQPVLIEVKGNATGTDFKEFNDKAGRTKALCGTHDIKCGIFCYKIDLQPHNLLKRFGFRYDPLHDPLGSVYFDTDTPPRMPQLPIAYPNIDFAICIQPTPPGEMLRQFFVRKNVNGRYIYNREAPVIKHMIGMVRSLTL
jgi:hypothetical protein